MHKNMFKLKESVELNVIVMNFSAVFSVTSTQPTETSLTSHLAKLSMNCLLASYLPAKLGVKA